MDCGERNACQLNRKVRPNPLAAMNKYISLLLGVWIAQCLAREPFKPQHGSIPFVVYFPSRYRGMCVGTLVSRMAVMTAAVCVTNPVSSVHDTRPINVILGATYRHPRRGIRVQVTKILLPKITNMTGVRAYFIERSAAVMLLKKKIPDALTEIPPRAISIDWQGEEALNLHEECFMPGWHFFYQGDVIYPVHRFLLQRNVRVQFLNIVKKSQWCEPLLIKFQKSLTNVGYFGIFDKNGCLCVKDGMYGAPLICRARAVGMLMAPDAQWSNCTGFTNLIHMLHANFQRGFFSCVSSLFNQDLNMDWKTMKKNLFEDSGHYDYVPAMYGHLQWDTSSSESIEI